MTVTWLSHDSHTVVTGQSHGCHMTVARLNDVDVFHMFSAAEYYEGMDTAAKRWEGLALVTTNYLLHVSVHLPSSNPHSICWWYW